MTATLVPTVPAEDRNRYAFATQIGRDVRSYAAPDPSPYAKYVAFGLAELW